MNSVGPGYFTTLDVPILAGRDFTVADTAVQQHGDKPDDIAPRVVIVNEKFAKRFFGSAGNAIGRHAGFGSDPGTKTDMEIIGVIKDIKYTNLRDEVPDSNVRAVSRGQPREQHDCVCPHHHGPRSVFFRGALESSRIGRQSVRSMPCAPWTIRSQTRC